MIANVVMGGAWDDGVTGEAKSSAAEPASDTVNGGIGGRYSFRMPILSS